MINKTLLYTTAWDDNVYGILTRDLNSRKVSAILTVEYSSGETSDIITVTRRDLATNKNCLDFFLDMEGDFTRDDIGRIKNKLWEILKVHSYLDTKDKATLTEIHKAISQYIRVNAEEPKDNPDAYCFIKEQYGYLRTERMDAFVREYSELGHKRLDILKRLKILGVLAVGKGRCYDTVVSINGKKVHFLKILLAKADSTEDEADEEVTAK